MKTEGCPGLESMFWAFLRAEFQERALINRISTIWQVSLKSHICDVVDENNLNQ